MAKHLKFVSLALRRSTARALRRCLADCFDHATMLTRRFGKNLMSNARQGNNSVSENKENESHCAPMTNLCPVFFHSGTLQPKSHRWCSMKTGLPNSDEGRLTDGTP